MRAAFLLRPTLMALLGLHDDYISDGRVLVEDVARSLLPNAYHDSKRYQLLLTLEAAYKQLNADVGRFGLDTLRASTLALESMSSGDATYLDVESHLASLGSQRDHLAAQIASALDDVEFGGHAISSRQAHEWTSDADALMEQAVDLGGTA